MAAAALDTSVSSINVRSSSCIVVQLRDELLEIRDVSLRELSVAAEVRGERRNAPGEQAIEQSLADGEQPLVAGDQRRIQKPAAVLVRVNGLLLQQPVEQRLDSGFLPVLLA